MKNLPKEIQDKINKIQESMLPQINIPGSIVYKKLGLVESNAVLEYAKTQKKTVRRAKIGECQYTIELEKERSKNPKIERPNDYLLSAKQAAVILQVPLPFVNRLRKKGDLQGEEVGKRFYYKPEEVERLKIQRAIDKL